LFERTANKPEVEYNCKICGYKFYHIPGTEWPSGSINNELIAKGNERLQREKEQFERDFAQYWYMNNH
jgi:hypothetical protein